MSVLGKTATLPIRAHKMNHGEFFRCQEGDVKVFAADNPLAGQSKNEVARRGLFDQVRFTHAPQHGNEEGLLHRSEGAVLHEHSEETVGTPRHRARRSRSVSVAPT